MTTPLILSHVGDQLWILLFYGAQSIYKMIDDSFYARPSILGTLLETQFYYTILLRGQRTTEELKISGLCRPFSVIFSKKD